MSEKYLRVLISCLILGFPTLAAAKDLSAALLAGAADLMAPYRAEAGATGAVTEAIAIATASGLGVVPGGRHRPQIPVEGLSKALMIGKQGAWQLDALAAIANAQGDDAAMTAAIATLYGRIGYAMPTGVALTRLIADTRTALAPAAPMTDDIALAGLGSTVRLSLDGASRSATMVVETDISGQSRRVIFHGRWRFRPDSGRTALEGFFAADTAPRIEDGPKLLAQSQPDTAPDKTDQKDPASEPPAPAPAPASANDAGKAKVTDGTGTLPVPQPPVETPQPLPGPVALPAPLPLPGEALTPVQPVDPAKPVIAQPAGSEVTPDVVEKLRALQRRQDQIDKGPLSRGPVKAIRTFTPPWGTGEPKQVSDLNTFNNAPEYVQTPNGQIYFDQRVPGERLPNGAIVIKGDALLYMLPSYTIGSFDVQDDAYQQQLEKAESDLRLATGDVERAEAAFVAEEQRFGILVDAAATARAAVPPLETAWRTANKAVIDYAPAEDSKTGQYREIESRLAALSARAETLFDQIQFMRSSQSTIDDAAFRSLDKLNAEIRAAEIVRNELDTTLGFTAAKKALVAAALQAYADASAAQQKADQNSAAVIGARKRLDTSAKKLEDLKAEVGRLAGVALLMRSANTRIVGFRLYRSGDMIGEIIAGTPADRKLLDRLNDRIDSYKGIVSDLGNERSLARNVFLDRQAEATERLADFRRATIASDVAQIATEAGFFIKDVAEGWVKEGGPIGGLKAAVTKAAFATAFGRPKLEEADTGKAFAADDGDLPPAVYSSLQRVAAYTGSPFPQLAKTERLASVPVLMFFGTHDLQAYETGSRKILGPDWETQGSPEAAAAALSALKLASSELASAASDSFFASLAGTQAGGLLKKALDAAGKLATRDNAAEAGKAGVQWGIKFALKKVIADLFESRAVKSYLVAENRARAASRYYLASINAYWKAYETYEYHRAQRDYQLSMFDPVSNLRFRGTTGLFAQFSYGSRLAIQLINAEGLPFTSDTRRIEVRLGGKIAESIGGGRFQIDARELADDGNWNVNLEVIVAPAR